MAEPIKIVLTNTGAFDGSTPIVVDRSTLGSGPVYTANVNGGGFIPASIFSLVSPTTVKVVSIAIDSDFPGAVAHVTSPDSIEPIRHVTLNSAYQSVLMAGNEVLRIIWNGPGRSRRVNLIVQDLGEQEVTPFMRVEHRPIELMSRYYIEVQGGGQFSFGTNPLQPIWTYDPALQIRRAAVPSGVGWLAVGDLAPIKGHYRRGIYVWARMSQAPAVAALEVGLKAPFSNEFAQVTGAPNMKWSKPVWMSATDKIAFQVDNAAGAQFAVELDVSPVLIRRIKDPV